jgi:hypothetical protein
MPRFEIEAPSILAGQSLAERVAPRRPRLHPQLDGSVAVQVFLPDAAIAQLLRAVQSWLDDYLIEATTVRVDGRAYAIARHSPLSWQPPDASLAEVEQLSGHPARSSA